MEEEDGEGTSYDTQGVFWRLAVKNGLVGFCGVVACVI